jgi:hypothetical protein
LRQKGVEPELSESSDVELGHGPISPQAAPDGEVAVNRPNVRNIGFLQILVILAFDPDEAELLIDAANLHEGVEGGTTSKMVRRTRCPLDFDSGHLARARNDHANPWEERIAQAF